MRWIKRVWYVYIRMSWRRLWIRRDEFHRSLDMDVDAMLYMSKDEQYRYKSDLIWRRSIAHRRGEL